MPEKDVGHKSLIEKFYTSFAQLDAMGMASCYHENIHFLDPDFGNLRGKEASKMREILIRRSKGNLAVTFSDVWAEDGYGGASWKAKYKYGNRPVINQIKARFKFSKEEIIEQNDSFNVWKWSNQALGVAGFLIGWTTVFQSTLQKKIKATT